MYESPCVPAGTRCIAPDRYESALDGGALGDTLDKSDMNNYRASLNMSLSDNYSAEKLYTSIIDTERASVQPTHIVNANFDVIFDDMLTIGLYATNLFDECYIASVLDQPGTLGLTNYAPPRMYGVKATFTY